MENSLKMRILQSGGFGGLKAFTDFFEKTHWSLEKDL